MAIAHPMPMNEGLLLPSDLTKKERMNHKLPMLPAERLEGKEEEHIMTISTKRSDCKYCSYLRLLHKAEEDTMEPPKVASVKQMCSKCNVYLCKEHFATYHFCGTSNNEDDEMDESE